MANTAFKGINMKNNDNNTRANDRLGKANFFLKLATLVATAIGTPVMGLIVSSYLNGRQTIETNARIYTELMSKREESETALRKDMFESIIGTFLKPNSPRTDLADIETKLLNLELLAYNFHESIDLGPLFKHMDRQIKVSHNSHKTEYLKRLKKLAKELSYKQLAVLGEAGRRVDATIEFENTDSIIIDTSLKLKLEGGSEDNKGLTTRDFRLWGQALERDRAHPGWRAARGLHLRAVSGRERREDLQV